MLTKHKRKVRRSVSDVSGGNSIWKNMASVVTNFKSSYTQPYYTASDRHSNPLDLIKSPTSPTAREHKQQEDDLSRRKSFEVADLHRVDRSSVCLDRFSTCLTPTATSFSTDELNEIFNIGRNNMNAAPIDLQNDLGEISPHNMPLNESSLSIDSSTCGTPFKTDEQHTENNADTSFNKSMPPPLDLHEISAIETPKHDSLMLNPRSPFTPSPDGRASFSPIQMVCREIFMTEKSYVNDLQEVIEGYIYHLKQQMELDVESIFGNLEDIYEFNKDVLYQLEQCETVDFEIDPIQLAMVFIEKARGFNHHYVKYCTNYPEASTFFAIIMQDPGIQHFFVERQKLVGHALPLESYLLKPVQRIMKYHLLFRDILKKYDGDEDGYDTLNTAVLAMSDVAEYINEMKRLHENAAKVQHILSRIIDLDVPIDVFETGRLVLENTFKVHGSRGDRIMYLFEKLLLICKKNEDKLYQFKEKIECSNMMLVESLPKDPLAFQIMRFDNQKVNYTIVAKSLEVKKDWTQHLKRLILENHAANIPQTARQAILGPEEKKKSKYNSLSITALDDSVMGHLRLTKSNQKSTLGKENVYVTTGMKRENNEKETSVAHAPKRSLNTKAKEYLMEKKSRNVANQSNAGTPSPDKDKKEKRWKKKHKHKPSLDSILILEDDASQKSLLMDSTSKSRSLESLKDSLRTQDSTENQEAIERNILQEIINHNFDKNDTTTPTSMKLHDESNGAENALNRNSQLYNEITDESCRDVVSESRNEFKARSISKSMSLNVPTTNKSVKNDDMKRWSKLSDTDPMELLEKRLSILNDDELSSASIKNMVRKVSNAFNSSFQAYDDSPRTVVSNEMDITRNMDILTGRADGAIKATNRRSTGEMSAPKVHVSSMRIGRSRSELSVYNENVKIDVKDFSTDNLETRNTVVDSEESNRWSADVDQVFDEVNADINSIADSLSSDANKSNESVSDSSETTTPDMNSNKRAALVDARLNVVANEERSSPSSTRKVNVEVKRVADRIKEYKKLIDAEKQRNSWRRREPRSMNEMIETLDSISTVNNGLSPVYSTHRRRFKSSRDYENDERRSSEDSNGSWSVSVIRSFSENYNPEKPTEISSPRINTKESLLRTSLTESLTSASDSSVGDHKTIKDIEIMKQRAQRYRDALQNFESRASVSDSPTPEYDTNCPEHNNNRPEHNNNRPEHNNNRPEQESRDLQK